MQYQSSLARKDEFISVLKDMQANYPEYDQILQMLVKQIEEGKLLTIEKKLHQLETETW